jgi:Cu(I)/Ag(I) efflux system membrane fusion protein
MSHLGVLGLLVGTAFFTGCVAKQKVPSESGATTVSASRVGPFQVSVSNKPPRPIVGDNTMVIAVRDSAGQPVPDGQVQVLVWMAQMGAMPRMESRGQVHETSPGTYEARYGLAMQGDWTVNLGLRDTEGREANGSYRLSTSTTEIAFESGTPAPGGSSGVAPSPPGATSAGIVSMDASRRQEVGVRTAPIAVRRLTTTIRAAGKVAYDETRRADVSLKFSGWIRAIDVDYTGKAVQKGERLLSVYSPELLTAQQEYLEALRAEPGTDPSENPSSLAAAARQRLLLWDIPPAQVDAIAKSGKPLESVPIVAPTSGVVLEKSVVQGSAFIAGQVLYRIASVNPVWVVASIYQYELPLVEVGAGAEIETPFLPEGSRRGKVSYINPYLDPQTRTGEVRLSVPNSRGDLKPGMFVDVTLERDLGARLAVPESAVLYSGERRIVFVDLGDGRLAPRDVTLGPKAGDYYEIRSGLKAGEVVVTSGNFLVAAESRIQGAAESP